jgi:GNAT-like C-terminal domain
MSLAFMDEQLIAQHGAEARLGAATIQSLRAFARHISEHQQLVASAAHHAIYDTDTDFTQAVRVADTVFGTDADLLHALFTLDCLRVIRERQAERGIPPSLAVASFQRHAGGPLRTAEAQGNVASVDWVPSWLRTLASGLYWLGRLEFVLMTFAYPQRVYRHRQTGEVIALAEAGERFSDEGVAVGPLTWVSTLIETDDAIVGTPLSPQGYALRQVVRLPRNEWDLVLKAGDPVLDLHVPGEEPLTIDALREAHTQAATFFDHYYPERPFVAYTCDSWLFSPLLEEMLGPDSNIVRWQQEGYLLPDDSEGEDLVGLAEAPRDTRLRRALTDRLAQGKLLYCGRYLFLRQHLDRFGLQPYRGASARAIARLTLQST